MEQYHPTEHPIRRRKENKFKAEKVDKYGRLSREFLEWTAFTEGKFIRHKFNGQERSLGRLNMRVDGFDGETAYQFHG